MPFASVAFIVTLVVPAVVGVPLITPSLLKISPEGRPNGTLQTYGAVPLLAAIVLVYAFPTLPLGSDAVVTVVCVVEAVKSAVSV